jgi:hypothetical protein
MTSEVTAYDQRNTREIFGKALAALVAVQANSLSFGELPEPERETIATWAAKARVDLTKLDAKGRTRLLDVANTELMSVALGSTRPKTDDKLGELGLLTPRRYEVEIDGPIKLNIAEHGLTKDDLLDAVHYPNAYQHLSPPKEFGSDGELVSLFVRVRNLTAVRENRDAPEWSVVIGRRNGRKFIACDGYRITRTMIKDEGETPLALFRSFCDAYGCDLKLSGQPMGKFLVYARVKGNQRLDATAPPGHKLSIATMVKFTGVETELAFGYAIDLTAYDRALHRRAG